MVSPLFRIKIPKSFCRLVFIVFLFGLKQSGMGQSQGDTLNRLNRANKKIGYWTFFFDSTFKFCSPSQARYYGYTYYSKLSGKQKTQPLGRFKKRWRIEYKSDSVVGSMGRATLLNGELHYYYPPSNQAYFYEYYRRGRLSVFKQFDYSKFSSPEIETIYFDSLYNGSPNSYLLYFSDNNIPLFKEYINMKVPQRRTYFVRYKEKFFVHRPLIGYHGTLNFGVPKGLQAKEFVELGYSRKFIHSLFIDTTGRYYERNNDRYLAGNVSLLAGNANNSYCAALKLSASYVYTIYRAEAGIIHYSNGTKNDPRLLIGGGMSFFNIGNVMINYSLPLNPSPFNDVGRFSINVFIN